MATASLRIGRAIAASGLTVMGGFAVLAFSDFPLLDNFGKVTALNIGLSLLSTLILLPPLLVGRTATTTTSAPPPTPLPSRASTRGGSPAMPERTMRALRLTSLTGGAGLEIAECPRP